VGIGKNYRFNSLSDDFQTLFQIIGSDPGPISMTGENR